MFESLRLNSLEATTSLTQGDTTAYIPKDSLALDLGGSKSIFPSRLNLLNFAALCDVQSPRERIENLLRAAEVVMHRECEVAASIPHVVAAIGQGTAQFEKTFLSATPVGAKKKGRSNSNALAQTQQSVDGEDSPGS